MRFYKGYNLITSHETVLCETWVKIDTWLAVSTRNLLEVSKCKSGVLLLGQCCCWDNAAANDLVSSRTEGTQADDEGVLATDTDLWGILNAELLRARRADIITRRSMRTMVCGDIFVDDARRQLVKLQVDHGFSAVNGVPRWVGAKRVRVWVAVRRCRPCRRRGHRRWCCCC